MGRAVGRLGEQSTTCWRELTAIEYGLLFELSANAGRVMTYDRLMQRVWGLREYSDAVQLVPDNESTDYRAFEKIVQCRRLGGAQSPIPHFCQAS